jgi:S-adenosylmethionine decarboxylase
VRAGDHWYVFIADRVDRHIAEGHTLDCDQTLNMYMYDIDPLVAQLFMKADPLIIPSILEGNNGDDSNSEPSEKKMADLEKNGFASEFSTSAAEATARSGIGKLMPDGAVVHDYMFEPCGYSMNGRAAGDAYWTIHITPEAHCSYASFETNYQCESYADLIKRIVAVFKPKKFTTVEHIDKLSSAGKTGRPLCPAGVDAFKVVGRSVTEFSDQAYSIQLCNFKREAGANGRIMCDN